MRIAIVGTELCAVDAGGGGLEQVLRRWAAELAARHEVIVVSHRPGGRPLVLDRDEPYATVAIDHADDLAGIEADVFSLHNRPQWAGSCAPAAAVGLTFHNYPAAWKSTARTPPAARMSAVSAALAATAAIHFGVPVATVAPSIHPAFCRRRAWRPSRSVVSPNRLMRKKGVHELLDLARRPEFAAVRFDFADLISPWLRPTAEHRELRAAIAAVPNAALFRPAPDPTALAARYATAGVVVCAAQAPEGLGLVPLEAQAVGVAVVTTDVGGLREATFAPNVCVRTEALGPALLDALERREPAEDARQAVLERYAPAASATAFERWLTEVG